MAKTRASTRDGVKRVPPATQAGREGLLGYICDVSTRSKLDQNHVEFGSLERQKSTHASGDKKTTADI